jgi:hypothetical protein
MYNNYSIILFPVFISMSKSPEENHGIYSESGKCLIEAPAPELLKRFEENARVEYFRAQVEGVVKDHYPIPDGDVEGMKKHCHDLLRLYELCLLDQLDKHLGANYGKGPRVGMRGTVCSIASEIAYKDLFIRNLDQTLMDGTEKEGDHTLITTMGEGNSELHYRTSQYLVEGPQNLRKQLEERPDLQKKLFPILLVYDLDKLTPGGALYAAILPSSAKERAGAIKKAYILDYPKAIWEI